MQENTLITTIDTLKSFGQIDSLKAMLENLKAAVNYAEEVISGLDSPQPVSGVVNLENTDDTSDRNKAVYFNPDWNYETKYKYILKKENRFLHFREAAKILVELQGSGDEDKLTARLGHASRTLKKEKKIVMVQHGKSKSASFWGSPKWLNPDGSIKEEHMYRTDILKRDRGSGGEASLFDI